MTTALALVADGLLGGSPDALALHDGDRAVAYAELAELVAAEAERLGPRRAVVPLTLRADLDSVVALLGAIEARHPVLLLAPDAEERQREMIELVRAADALHPDLALLLSTSGSTGSPKLVRLSHANLLSNARAIADYLGLRAEDRAITSLPLHYCYGLSVLTSHLAAGAGVVLSDLSVADACFWDAVARHEVTGFAGVPYTFELWEHSGHGAPPPPSLRYVTQAGGRMHPDRIRRVAALGEEHGFDLVVMYGQTEATARMAYLPPHLAAACPEAIGIPIPGGALRVEPQPGLADGVGELVYTGPNVMMGYATRAADLARGPELTELRTGDLGRQRDDGLWEVVGRRDRHAKVFGLRLDLDWVEAALSEPALLHAHGERLVAFHERPRRGDRVRAEVAAATGLPPAAIVVHRVEAWPRTPSGKPDRAALRHQAALLLDAAEPTAGADDGPLTPDAVRDVLAVCLHRPEATLEDSFVSLGGDSLSFVEVSTRLAQHLGRLPAGWQHLSARELAASVVAAAPARAGWRQVEVPTLLRAGAILAIVVAHVDLWLLLGGAHVLLAVAGFNLARFQLATPGRRRRVRAVLGGVARAAVPASLWIAFAALVTGNYELRTALYLTNLLGPQTWSADWQLWFLEVFVWSGLAVALLVAVPAIDRVQRRRPFEVAAAVVVACLALRYATVGVAAESIERYMLPHVLWCVALGGAAAFVRTPRQRLVVLALTAVGCAGFFVDDPQRQLVLAVGIALLLVERSVWLPALLAGAIAVLAQASLWIYLTHWQVYPSLEAAGHPWLALAASIAVGVAAERGYRIASGLSRGRRPRTAPRPAPSAR